MKNKKEGYKNWRDLPEKDYKRCEYCGKWFMHLQTHINKVHGKGQTKLKNVF